MSLEDYIISKFLKFPDIKDIDFDYYRKRLTNEQFNSLEQKIISKHIPLTKNLEKFLRYELASPRTQIQVGRNLKTGEVNLDEIYEVDRLVDGSENSKNSASMMNRQAHTRTNRGDTSVKGGVTGTAFQPGGMPSYTDEEKEKFRDHLATQTDDVRELLKFPPGFMQGFDFDESCVVDRPFGYSEMGPKTENPDESVEKTLETLKIEENIDTTNSLEIDNSPDSVIQELSEAFSSTKDVIRLDKSQKQYTKNVLASKYVIPLDSTKDVKDFEEKIKPNMAMQFPFKLDPFQQNAVKCLENRESILVAAHTSAGKTVVAEYAISLAARHMTKVIYTSPIKALSNQKFRDFRNTFGDVGLLTGDIQMHPEAFCLIMTTEVLRSMLYHGSDVIRDVEFVIFDECHYLNDPDRGVVWEEVLIMLPDHIGIIMLSATVPNINEFADWVGRTKQRPIYVVQTLNRPVPLEYYLFTGSSRKHIKELFKIVDKGGKWNDNEFKKAVLAKKERASDFKSGFGARGGNGGGGNQAERQIWQTVIELLEKREGLPAVAFTLSRKRCDSNAALLSHLDLTSQTEKSHIHGFFNRVLSRLNKSDRDLPQILRMVELTKRGIAVHHSGILPILKESVELLFAKGLIKLLFATETFAMGVNMPARSVLFDSIRKHDGTCVRNLKTSEFIQMAGRAGRRGLDSVGTVIMLCKQVECPPAEDLRAMLLGKASKLESKFRLTYQMLLNQIRSSSLDPYDILKRSFSEVGGRKQEPIKQEKLEHLEKSLSEFTGVNHKLEEYAKCLKEIEEDNKYIMNSLCYNMGQGSIIVLNSGYLGVVIDRTDDRVFEVMFFNKTGDKNQDSTDWNLTCAPVYTNPPYKPTLEKIDLSEISKLLTGGPSLKQVNLSNIIKDFQRRSNPRFQDAAPSENTVKAANTLGLISKSKKLSRVELKTQVPALVNIKKSFNKNLDKIENHEAYFNVDKIEIQGGLTKIVEYLETKNEIDEVKFSLSNESLMLDKEYKSRIQVLQDLGYLDSQNTVSLKGRVACTLSAAHCEVTLTELLFSNFFEHLNVSQCCAILSSFVLHQKTDRSEWLEYIEDDEVLLNAMDELRKTAEGVAKCQLKNGMETTVEFDFMEQFQFGLVPLVKFWAEGRQFVELIPMSSIHEGTIVKTIQRLEECLRDIKGAAKLVGDSSLEAKMEEASLLVRRDIIFCPSLYTS